MSGFTMGSVAATPPGCGAEAGSRSEANATPPAAEQACVRTDGIDFPVSKSPVQERRRERWAMRKFLHEYSSLKPVRLCGLAPIRSEVELRLSDGGHAGFSGFKRCGSVWSCPVCAAVVAGKRQRELEDLAKAASEQGYFISMLTLTLQHSRGDSIEEIWKGISTGWASVISGRQWLTAKEQLGIAGYVKAVEVTFGKNGPHVHLHVIFFTEKNPLTARLRFQRKQGRAKTPYPVIEKTPEDFLAEKWEKGLAKTGFRMIREIYDPEKDEFRKPGLTWEVAPPGKGCAAMARYAAKIQAVAISKEATMGQMKQGHGDSRTPFQILASAMQGNEKDLRFWHAWEKKSHGHRQMTWSKGLREMFSLEPEKTDEELVNEDSGGEVVAIIRFDPTEFKRYDWLDLLEIAETFGADAARAWLTQRGIVYRLPDPPPV
jgi:hypothetical protein